MWLLFNDAYSIYLSPLIFVVSIGGLHLISVNCDKEFWSLSSDSVTAWSHKDPSFFSLIELVVFWTESQWFWTGTHVFSQDESRTHRNYFEQNHWSFLQTIFLIVLFNMNKTSFLHPDKSFSLPSAIPSITIWSRLFKPWRVLSTGLITIQRISIRKTNREEKCDVTLP